MQKFGLIGYPISHSLSPKLCKEGLGNNVKYDLLEGKDFEQLFSVFVSNYQGVNITTPFKEEAFNKIVQLTLTGQGEISGPCAKVGATNLLVKNGDIIMAHNTDFTAVILSIAQALFPGIVEEFYKIYGLNTHIKIHQFCRSQIPLLYKYKPEALIVGCGGAGKAAAVAAAEMGFDVAIMNRTIQTAQNFSQQHKEYNFISVPITDFVGSVKECDVVIYTLPERIDAINNLTTQDYIGEGNYNKTTTNSVQEDTLYFNRPNKIILEASYANPSFRQEDMVKILQAGSVYIPGERWLLYQALTGFGIMSGRLPNLYKMETVL